VAAAQADLAASDAAVAALRSAADAALVRYTVHTSVLSGALQAASATAEEERAANASRDAAIAALKLAKVALTEQLVSARADAAATSECAKLELAKAANAEVELKSRLSACLDAMRSDVAAAEANAAAASNRAWREASSLANERATHAACAMERDAKRDLATQLQSKLSAALVASDAAASAAEAAQRALQAQQGEHALTLADLHALQQTSGANAAEGEDINVPGLSRSTAEIASAQAVVLQLAIVDPAQTAQARAQIAQLTASVEVRTAVLQARAHDSVLTAAHTQAARDTLRTKDAALHVMEQRLAALDIELEAARSSTQTKLTANELTVQSAAVGGLAILAAIAYVFSNQA